MKKLTILVLAFIPLLLCTNCTEVEDEYVSTTPTDRNWEAVADSSTNSLCSNFWYEKGGYFNNDYNGETPGWGYWPQAHAMDVLIDAYKRTGKEEYKNYFSKWYEGIKVANGNTYYNPFFDDMEWIALTMTRLYNVTNEQKYLDTATEMWGYIKEGWNETYMDGGVTWNHDNIWSKNACSNGPAALLAIYLYEITKDESYKDWAVKIYNWERNNLFNKASGAVYDNVNSKTGEVNTQSLSYNQGTFLGAAHELYKLTGDFIYMKDATRAANFCITNSGMIDAGNNVLRNEGDGDGALFKGIFMRYFVQLLLDKNLDGRYKNKFTTFFNNNVNVLLNKGMDKINWLFGADWAVAPSATTYLNAQVSGCTLLEAKALYERSK